MIQIHSRLCQLVDLLVFVRKKGHVRIAIEYSYHSLDNKSIGYCYLKTQEDLDCLAALFDRQTLHPWNQLIWENQLSQYKMAITFKVHWHGRKRVNLLNLDGWRLWSFQTHATKIVLEHLQNTVWNSKMKWNIRRKLNWANWES